MFNSSPSVIEIFISFFPISTCSVHPRKFILNVYLFHLSGMMGIKAKHIVFYLHSGEAVNDGKPAACHTGDVQSLAKFIVVVVEIQSGSMKKKVVGLVDVTYP